MPVQTGSLESNNITRSNNQPEAANQGGNWPEQITEDDRGSWQQSTYSQLNDLGNANEAERDPSWQQNPGNNWPQETRQNLNPEEGHRQEAQQVWQEDGSREAVQSWSEGPSDPPRIRRAIPVRRFGRFHPPDDDNVYSMELRELLSR